MVIHYCAFFSSVFASDSSLFYRRDRKFFFNLDPFKLFIIYLSITLISIFKSTPKAHPKHQKHTQNTQSTPKWVCFWCFGCASKKKKFIIWTLAQNMFSMYCAIVLLNNWYVLFPFQLYSIKALYKLCQVSDKLFVWQTFLLY